MPLFLETSRLALRHFTDDDVDHLVALDSDPDVMRFINGGRSRTREEISGRIIPFFRSFYERSGGFGYWAAEARATGAFLGWFHLRPAGDACADLGYRLRKDAWNKGYATEGARALVRTGFTELGLDRVTAHTMVVNHASRRVMEKCGLVLVRTYHPGDLAPVPGAEKGAVEYALTRQQWQHLAADHRVEPGGAGAGWS